MLQLSRQHAVGYQDEFPVLGGEVLISCFGYDLISDCLMLSSCLEAYRQRRQRHFVELETW